MSFPVAQNRKSTGNLVPKFSCFGKIEIVSSLTAERLDVDVTTVYE